MKLKHTKAKKANRPFFFKKSDHVKHSAARYAKREGVHPAQGRCFGYQVRTQAIALRTGVIKTIQHVAR